MAVLRDKEEEKGQGTSQALGQQVPGQQQAQEQAPQEQQSSAPATIGASSATQTSAPVKAMPKQQKAGTGTFANLKSYLQAAQGGGQQRVAQAATQQIQNLGASAQKGIQQAQESFGRQMQAGSIKNMETAAEEARGIIGAARGATYQATQPTPEQTPPKGSIARRDLTGERVPTPNEEYLKSVLGNKYLDFQNDMNALRGRQVSMDMVYNPITGSFGSSTGASAARSVYEKYGVDVTKLPSYTPFDQYKAKESGVLSKKDLVSEPTTPIPAKTQPQAPAATQQYFTPEQQQRFADIINAQYQGPQSLQQAGLYEQAARKARAAQQSAELTQTAGGREQLLKDIFGRNRDYSRGASRLDALLLNASEQGVKNLQQQAQPALQSQQALQAAQNLSANEAAQRAAAIEQIRSGTRQAFTEARTAEEQATEKRIDDLIKTPAKDAQGNPIQKLDAEGKPAVDAEGKPIYITEWERLPEYFRQSLSNKGTANKQIQEESIKNLEQTTGLSTKRFDELPSQISALQQSIEQLKSRQNRIINGPFGKVSVPDPQAREQLQKAMQDLDALNAEYASYGDFGNQLNSIRNINQNQWILSPEEAAILGVSAGEGLYNIRPEDIRTAQAERARLITKDELSRQLALAQLAGTDISNQLQKDLLYSNLEKAGTQDLTKSLDTEALRKLLNESQAGFKTAAEAANLTGTGEKKVSRGNIFGKKTKTYGATVEGNVADMLRQAGYDVGSETPSGTRSLLTDKDLLNRYLDATNTRRSTDSNIGGSALEGSASGAGTGAAIGTAVGGLGIGTGVGAAVGATVGGMTGANTTDQIQYYTDLAKELEDKLGIKGLGAAGQGVQDIRSAAGGVFSGAGNALGSNVFGDIFRGIGGAVGGINTGAMRSYGEAIAKDIAIQDLKDKYAQWLQGQGFENRTNIANTETTRARTAALLDLLRRQG